MKQLSILTFFVLFTISFNGQEIENPHINLNVPAQNEEKQNPILFAEMFIGGFLGEFSGFLAGGELNYQQKKNLFTLRYSHITDIGISAAVMGLTAIPIPTSKGEMEEIALLYGLRYIKKGHSYSFSLGPSYNVYSFNGKENNEQHEINFLGISFESNIKWFKKEKRRYRINQIIPVGKPISFGHSYGFKLSGNISKTYYIGFSLIVGWGWHKKY